MTIDPTVLWCILVLWFLLSPAQDIIEVGKAFKTRKEKTGRYLR